MNFDFVVLIFENLDQNFFEMNNSCTFPRYSASYVRDKRVSITSIISPSSFVVHMTDEYDNFVKFENKMNLHYERNCHTLLIPKKDLSKHLTCVMFLHGEWSWGIILKNLTSTTGLVKHMDEDMTSRISMSELYILIEKLSKFPQQNLHCRLANMIPANMGFWTKNSIKFF